MEKIPETNGGKFKDASSLLPLFTIIVIVLGVMKQILYYKNYNLPIKYFLGLSELGLIISEDLLLIVPLMLVGVITIRFFATKEPQQKIHKSRKKISSGIFEKLFFLFGLAYSVFVFLYFNSYSMKLFGASLFLGTLCLVPFTFSRDFRCQLFPKVNDQAAFISFIGLTIFMTFRTAFEIRAVDVNHKYTGTIIKTVDSIYISNDSSYFIGKTDKYIFIYNKKKEATSIIPSDKITNIFMKSK